MARNRGLSPVVPLILLRIGIKPAMSGSYAFANTAPISDSVTVGRG